MALNYDPIAQEQLDGMRANLGALYVDAIWALRAFEQAARNEKATAHWRQSYPAWDRLFARPSKRVEVPDANIISMPKARLEESKAA